MTLNLNTIKFIDAGTKAFISGYDTNISDTEETGLNKCSTIRHRLLPLYLIPCLLFTLALFSVPSTAVSSVTGDCSNCHTMHYSQNGTQSSGWGGSGPYDALLTNDCVGCHSSTTAVTIINNTPIIYNTTSPTSILAGGNFYYAIADDSTGHNVSGIKAQDSTLGLTPPGGSAMSSQLTCAGEFGCHGDRSTGNNNIVGVTGAHHTDDSGGITGGTVGLSYRFLNGITGKEDTDWEQDNINTSHNEYQGATNFSTVSTISYLCGQCHGNSGSGGFHNSLGVGSASPWLRHPTDIALKSTGEYANYTTYSLVAPVARPDPDNVINTAAVTPGTDIVICISCHRSHASPYYKLLRWDFKGWPGNAATNGCNVCHTSKN